MLHVSQRSPVCTRRKDEPTVSRYIIACLDRADTCPKELDWTFRCLSILVVARTSCIFCPPSQTAEQLLKNARWAASHQALQEAEAQCVENIDERSRPADTLRKGRVHGERKPGCMTIVKQDAANTIKDELMSPGQLRCIGDIALMSHRLLMGCIHFTATSKDDNDPVRINEGRRKDERKRGAEIDDALRDRMTKATTARRRQFAYWEMHSRKLQSNTAKELHDHEDVEDAVLPTEPPEDPGAWHHRRCDWKTCQREKGSGRRLALSRHRVSLRTQI